MPNNPIGFFIHSSFPSSEIYKTFPYREQLLKSLLCSDVIGFHLFEYCRHFFTTCKRVLGLNHELRRNGTIGIDYHGRDVVMKVGHVAVQQKFLEDQMKTDVFRKTMNGFRAYWNKCKIIASVDLLHPRSGLLSKLVAFKYFLRDNPTFRGGACKLVQICTPPANYQPAEIIEQAAREK